jgi:hypothetical protein
MKVFTYTICSKIKNTNFINLILLLVVLFGTKCNAANWYVDNASSAGNIYNLTSAPFVAGNDTGAGSAISPFATLLKAYNTAAPGDTIYVDAGTYTDVNATSFNITKSITIIGAGFSETIFSRTSGIDRWSTINANNVVLKKFQIINYNNPADGIGLFISGGTGIILDQVGIYGCVGSAGQGAIYISGAATNVTIKNSALPCNRVGSALYGGALKITNSTVLIQNCSYSNNILSGINGSAILIEGNAANVTIEKSLFENNEAASGGAIYMTNGTLNVTGSCFNNNKSVNTSTNLGGGAVFIYASTNGTTTTANFTDCSFLNNAASGSSQDGGAVLFRSPSTAVTCNVVFKTCSFTGNTAADKGEDVYFQATATAYNVTFKNSTFNTIGAGTKVNLYNNNFNAAWIKFEGLTAPTSTGGNGDIVANTFGVAVSNPEMTGVYIESTTNVPIGLPVTTCVDRYNGVCGAVNQTFVCETTNTWGDVSLTASNADVVGFDKVANLPKTITLATNATSIVFTFAAHGFIVGDWVIIEGFMPVTYNGIYKITAKAINTFTVAKGVSPGILVTKGTATKGTPLGWSRKTNPTVDEHVIINYNYNTTTYGDIEACKMTVNPLITLTVDNDDKGNPGTDTLGTYAYVVNSIFNKGTINVNNNGNLIQENHPLDFNGEAVTTPSITITKTTSNKIKWDYVYWSKPLATASLVKANFDAKFDIKYYWDPAFCTLGINNDYLGWRTLALEPVVGTGFITRVKTAAGTTPTPITVISSGLTNNGDISAVVKWYDGNDQAYRNYTLLGNPYPGAINFEEFYKDNTDKIFGTAYLWSSITAYPGIGFYKEADYATYNLTGGVGVGLATTQTPNGTMPNGYIASGQGFMVRPKVIGTVTFNNSQRALKDISKNLIAPSNNQFFKTAAPIEKDRYWLRISDSNKRTNQQLIGYVPEATEGFDDAYDGVISSSSSLQFYSILENQNLVIQGKGTFNVNDTITLGYSKTNAVSNQLTISIENKEGIFSSRQNIYVHDKELNSYANISERPYEFIGTTNRNNRFEIVYQLPHVAPEPEIDLDTILISVSEATLTIFAPEPIVSVVLYDITGKLVFQKATTRMFTTLSTPISLSSGVYIAKVVLENKTTYTKKLIKI